VPTWGELLTELDRLQKSSKPGAAVSPQDILRRKYLTALNKHTGRSVIVYGTAWMEGRNEIPPNALSVATGDLHGFMEACSNAKDSGHLDLIITSPGGSAEAAESIMGYLRTQFEHIRVIVPVAAMSAATMMALSADEIVMGNHSQLGPIDPQFTIQTPDGPRTAPGQAIIDQFEQAKIECLDPKNIPAWVPLLRGLAPGLLAQCASARALAEEFARRSLEAHMFAGEDDAAAKAENAAAWFANFTEFKSHGRRVSRDDARAQGIKVLDLEDDKILQDLTLSVYHALRLTFSTTPAVKVVENHKGRAYIEQIQQVAVQVPGTAQGQPSQPARPVPPLGMPQQQQPGSAFGAAANRQQRRAESKGKGKGQS